MNANPVAHQFSAIGARLKLTPTPPARWQSNDYTIDIRRDRRGEFFELRVPDRLREQLDLTVLQADKRDRHLLLLVRRPEKKLDRFLCGHDERHWFVAAVPGGASTLRQAKDALQPEAIRRELRSHPLRADERHTRKNPVFRRQGEWFFFPLPRLVLAERLVLRDEPIQRDRSKPHLVENLVRFRGEVVYVCKQRAGAWTEAEYRNLLLRRPSAAAWDWEQRVRNAFVFARGTVRHADHATITLPFWHQVLLNNEHLSRAAGNVAFLD